MLLNNVTNVISRGFKAVAPDTIGSVAWEAGAKAVLNDNTQVNYFFNSPKLLLQTIALGNIFGVGSYWLGHFIDKQNQKFFPVDKGRFYPIKKSMRKMPITTLLTSALLLISGGMALREAYKAPFPQTEEKR